MKSLLKALPVVVLLLAACEAVRIRLSLPYRPTESRLFVQAALLWTLFGLMALLPAFLTLRILGARGREQTAESAAHGVRPGLILGAWMFGPVLVHQVLDQHIGIGGDLAALKRIQPWVEVLVALVVGALVYFCLARVLKRFAVARTGVALSALSLAVGLFLPWRSDAASAASAAKGLAERPNVLLLIWDTVRAANTTPYAYARDTTPHLAELAARSTVYEQARSVSCFTFTSHLSMLTGVLPSKHGGRLTFTRYRPERANLVARAFQEEGYRTGGFVGTDVIAGRTNIRYGFERYDDQVDPPACDTMAWALVHDVQSFLAARITFLKNNGRPHWIQDFQRPGDGVLDSALSWIRQDDARPWFCMINLYDAHWPYIPAEAGHERFVGPYDGPLDGFLFRSNFWDHDYEIQDADAEHLVDLYDAEIFDLDVLVDEFLGQLSLDAGGTAVLMTADHGEAFGEAGAWKHEDIYESQVHVPFLVRDAAAAPEGRRVETYVSGIDVAPTLLGLAGLGARVEELGMDGLDLQATDPTAEREILVEDRDHMDPREVNVALYRGPWKLLRRGLGEEAVHSLHDLRNDAEGSIDVAAGNPEVFEELVTRLTELRAEADVEDAQGPDPSEMSGFLDGLAGLGYFGR